MDAQMLEGKVALITGASYGMGRTIAELFAEEGACVVLTARHVEQLNEVVEGIRAKGGKAVGVVADFCSTEDTKRVFKTAIETYGDLDILINNAGIGEQKIIDDTSDEWMLHVMNTNLGGPMRYIREALKVFLPKNDGCIINISSVNGNRPFCGATYTSTKGALNTLTKNVAMRLIDTTIRCNAVAPGATVTPAHLANKAGEQPGGSKMLNWSGHFVPFPARNAIRSIRPMHVFTWQARWDVMSKDRSFRSVTALSYDEPYRQIFPPRGCMAVPGGKHFRSESRSNGGCGSRFRQHVPCSTAILRLCLITHFKSKQRHVRTYGYSETTNSNACRRKKLFGHACRYPRGSKASATFAADIASA